MKRRTVVGALAAAGCGKRVPAMNELAERYVRLILDIGEHEKKYVDAFYGPASWKPTAKKPLESLVVEASALVTDISRVPAEDAGRHAFLQTQTQAALAYVRLLSGEKLGFDEEAKALYGVTPPRVLASELAAAREKLEKIVPGKGDLSERLDAYQKRFEVPADRVDRVFRAAIDEARKRTKRWFTALASNERFDVEYVTGKVWSAYNWYKGDSHSLIQVNTDLPIGVDRIIHLACHEGYPGHHVYNGLLEAKLVREKGWLEYSVYPLYSPQSLIAEGTADFGVSLVLPDADRLAFKRDVLFREAGLDAKSAEEHHAILIGLRGVKHAAIQAARLLLDGQVQRSEAVAYLRQHALSTPGMAERRVKFIESERTYIINYSYGEDLVSGWIERTAGNEEAARWKAFGELLSTPRTPANLL